MVVATVLASVYSALAWDVLQSRLDPQNVLTSFASWLPGLLTGLAFGALGILPVVMSALGRPLRTAGNVISVCVALAVVAAAQFGVPYLASLPAPTAEAAPSAVGAPTQPEGIVLVVGQCLAADPATLNNPDGPLPMIVECDQPHLSEAFAEVTLSAGAAEPYPGLEETYYRSMELCSSAFLEFIGVPHSESSIGLQVHRPLQESWDSGTRTAQCLAVTDVEGSGTLHGANR